MAGGESKHRPVLKKGDRVELIHPATGARGHGTVQHVDAAQILVKWDDGRSESIDPEIDRLRIVDAA